MAKKYYDSKGSGFGMPGKGRANMPTEVVMKEYPKQGYAVSEGYYRDNLQGTDAFDKQYTSKIKSQMKK